MSASPELSRMPPEMGLRAALDGSASPLPFRAVEKQEEEFRTPTTEESRLNSVPTTCPPPPMKARRVAGCKRKLSEMEFFKVEAEEIERLFRPRTAASPLRRMQAGRRREESDSTSSLSCV
ncbi:hypothetical protein HPP92_025766 [Vanilla planifolia]|uniref:Uncharacterized protein n=1 Tax=Vanilla planifolia TaxID=51239 RepID=A0A835PMY7_VANPL|nr:hypothetical protein HPP92_025766 [Vanilla planifolia]